MKTGMVLWVIGSLSGMLLLAVALLVPGNTILKATPACYSVKQLGKECFMCGSTRSFIQAGMGNFKKAAELNTLALVLFILLSVNSIAFIIYISILKLKKK